ncbi:uncharacterized protein LOC133556006 isoform X1 [Nerophis ophidion]|uniref:uncharacterized protein LOC133556006 isoform X1 n=1 Tax=Nerophis ophidion TaxID=159077 RepID=UPI002AE023C8|nr:uncharacterized protein LOC133556006 isoform X1 [Nerophis ophidion]
MDVDECVLSAARAVLELAEREWQPLSEAELEQRLDQAVEQILEAELVNKVKSLHQSEVFVTGKPQEADVQLSQAADTTAAARERVEAERPQQCDVAVEQTTAVKYITAVLQGSKSKFPLTGRARLSLSQTVPLCLALMSERVSYRALSRHFGLEKGNIHRIFFHFCRRVNSLQEKHVRWPTGSEAEAVLFPLFEGADEDRAQGSCVPRVLGVLGHTRIPIRLPAGKHAVPQAKRMRKEDHGNSWLRLELVCDRAGRFLHCSVSEDQDTDGGVALSHKLQRNPVTPGSVLLARVGYPLTAHILTPYAAGSLGRGEKLLNATLEPHLRILDQAVADLKARFQRLQCLDIGNCSRAPAVVLTACVLHNLLLDIGDVVRGRVGGENVWSEEGEGEEEGVRQRDAIAEMLRSQSSGE